MDIQEIKKIKNEIEKEIEDFISLKLKEFEDKTGLKIISHGGLVAGRYDGSVNVLINPQIWD